MLVLRSQTNVKKAHMHNVFKNKLSLLQNDKKMCLKTKTFIFIYIWLKRYMNEIICTCGKN